MNKLFTKIVGLTLGLTMAVGVGVAVSSNSREASPVHADTTGTLEITISNFTEIKTSYTTTFTHSYTVQTSTVQVEAYGVYKNNNGIQMNKGKGTYIKNKQAIPGYITSIQCTWTATGKNSPTLYVAKDAVASTSSTSLGKGSSSSTSQTYTVTNPSTSLYNYFYFDGTTVTGACYMSSFKINYTVPATKTLSSIALSGTYPTSFTIGDSFDHTGMTVTATYSDSSTANVTSSATFSGYNMSTVGSQTVTVSYLEGGVTKTATYTITVTAPTTPYIDPAKNSTSGYSGQNESLSFTYGNLTGSLSITSSNTSVVTVGTPSTSAGSGTVQLNFVGAGSTTVLFLDGSTQMASVSVSVTASSVSITGLAATSTAYIGKTLNLGSTVNVTATGIYTNAVTWESEDDDIATVSAAGVVTGVAEGTVDITVTSDDYPSATMTCSVTVEEAPLETTYNFVTNFSSYASSWSGYSSKTLDGKTNLAGDYAATVTLPYASKQGSTITTMPVVADQSSGDVIHISFELTESGYELGNVSVTFAQWNTKAPTMKLFKGTTASGTELDSGVVGTKNTISATNVGGTTFVVAMNDNSTSRNQVGVESITITLKAAPVLSSVTTSGQKTSFEYGDTFSYGGTLTAHYTQGKADATVSPSKFKYGATSSFDADSSGTEITVGDSLAHATHDGVYVRVGYTEDNGTTYKWTDAYQISVEEAPTYYMVLNAYTDTGTNYGYKGGIIEIDVTESHLAGNISWTVTAGSVTDATGDNSSYLATIASVGTITITATDSGDNTNTDTVTFTIVDSLNTVMAASETPHASDLTFTAKAEGSGTADDGATYTVTSDAAESTYEDARGIHFGTNSSATVQYVQLSSSDVASGENNVIRSVVVNASDAQTEGNTASLTVTVGGVSFHCENSASATLGGQADYTFTGSGSGAVVIRAERSEAKYKGIYFKSVVVNYVTQGEESDIANAVGMHAAQKAVIDYAEDFNDTLEAICVAVGSTVTDDLEGAWGNLATQYTNWFTNSAKSLSAEEKAHAKALFGHASSVDRNVTASADELQHMLAKYDYIVAHYSGCADFLNTDAGTGRDPVSQSIRIPVISTIVGNGNTVAIVVITSVLGLTAVGGYFFLRKRKEI